MAFSIQEIQSNINQQNGLVYTANFYVQITPPAKLISRNGNKIVPFFCTDAQIPGLTLGAHDIYQSGYGIPERRPVAASYQDFTLQFLCDGKGDIFSFFEEWMAMLHNTDASKGMQASVNNLKPGEFGYPSDYEGIIEIFNLDTTKKTIMSHKVSQAYPMTMHDIPISWREQDNVLNLTIMFNYCYWTSSLTKTPSNENIENSYLYMVQTSNNH